jgi:hypothetical protein
MAIPDLGLSTPTAKKDTESDIPDIGLGESKQGEQLSDIPQLKLEAGAGEKFLYGFKTMPSFSEGVADYLERRFPLGRLQFYSPGEGWHMPRYVAPPTAVVEAAKQKNYAEAKRILEAQDQYEVESMAPWVATDKSQQGGAAQLAGNVAAILLDPTTLVPIAKAAKLSYAQGGLIGAADATAYSLSLDDKVDPVVTLLGATGGVVGTAGVRYLGGKMSRLMQSADLKTANAIARQFEDRVAYYRNQPGGMYTATAFRKAKEDLNLDEDALAGLTMKIGRQLDFRRASAEADLVVEGAKKGLRDFAAKAKISPDVSGLSKTIDDFLGTVSTRVKQISPAVWGRLRKLDFAEHYNTHQYFEKVQPFVDDLHKLKRTDKRAYRELSKALYNQDKIAAERIMARFGKNKMMDNYKSVRGILDELGGSLKDVGYKMDLLEEFFPRVIKDVTKLMKALPSETRSLIQKNMREAGVALDGNVDEVGHFINKYLRGRLSGEQIDQVLGATKARNIETVTDMLLPHYADPAAALHSYIRRSVHDIERRKFFGRGAKVTDQGGDLKIQDSIGGVIAESMKRGDLDITAAEELRDLLVARFDLGHRTGYSMMQNFRNLAYMSTIGNPVSALTQIGDIGVSAFAHGVRNTLSSLFGAKAIRVGELGINDIAQEFASTLGTARVLERVMRLSGFKAIDQLGKNVSINAALKKWQTSVKTPKGVEQLRKRYGAVFGDEFDDVVVDLQNRQMTDNVKLLLFNELADVQPITLSEMPLKYLQNPNGRVFYMLKTFTLKQLDIMRRNIWHEYKAGNNLVAAKNATRYLGLVTAFNLTAEMSKSALLTQEIDVDRVPDMAVTTLFKNFGASEYIFNKYGSKGQVGSLLGELVAPPLNVVDGMAGVFLDPDNMDQHLKHMPLFGLMYYYWFGPGMERLNQRLDKESREEFTEGFDIDMGGM